MFHAVCETLHLNLIISLKSKKSGKSKKLFHVMHKKQRSMHKMRQIFIPKNTKVNANKI